MFLQYIIILTSGQKNFRIFSQTVFFSTVLKSFQKLLEDL